MSASTISNRRAENWKSHTILYFASFVALGLMVAAIGPTLPSLARSTHSSSSEVGLLFVSLSLGYMLGSQVGGKLFDRADGNRVLAWVLAASALMIAIIPFFTSLWLLIAVAPVLGLAQGALDVGGNALLIRVNGSDSGPFLNGLHFSFGVGSFLSPIIVAQAGSLADSDLRAYGVIALLTIPVAALLGRLRGPEARAVFEEDEKKKSNRALVLLIAVFLFFCVGVEGGFGGWIFSFALAEGVADRETSAYLTSAFWGALTMGRLLGVWLAARLIPQAILAADLAGCIASLWLIIFFPASTAAVWAGTVGLGLSMASVFPAMLSYAEKRLTVDAQTTGRLVLGASAGYMTLPWLAGQMFDARGPLSMISTMLAAMIAASITLAAIQRLTSDVR
jgi:FHS family Na+ dependent glucose MFS transporter 1